MSLTCHFIDDHWERKQVVLNIKAMSGSHTGDYISELFLNMMDQWDINIERVVLVLRDSGANMVKGMRLAEIPDLSCSAHTLQLVVNEGISSQRAVGDIISKALQQLCASKTVSEGHSRRTWPPPAQDHSSCSHPLELHSAHVAEDAGAEVCPKRICRRTWEVYMSNCRTMGYHLKLDRDTGPY